MKSIVSLAIVLVLSVTWTVQAAAGRCPLDEVAASEIEGPLAKASVRANYEFAAVMFRSGFEIDYDGAPTAYHQGNADDSSDPGLDHICNSGTILEFKDGRLIDKYGPAGTIGRLDGVDPTTNIKRSKLCKRDYIAIRDSKFPTCGPGHLCMIFYGIAVEPRECGYPNGFDGVTDKRCGIPIRQHDEQGQPSGFYLTTTQLHRKNMKEGSRRQWDYVDASKIPFIVMPGGQKLPGNIPYRAGDIAIVVRGKKVAYGVIGDSGPSSKLGEASPALLWELDTTGPVEFESLPPAITLLIPGTAKLLKPGWPIDPVDIRVNARNLLNQLSIESLRSCPGLENLQ